MHDRHHIALLVVDPDEAFRSTLTRTFARRGIQVQEAADGESALSVAQRKMFDVAILDIKMPGLSGIELLEKFRDSHSECEVIVLTGQGTIELAVQAMKLGVYDFLTKPFPIADLEKLVTKAHERGQLRRENLRLKTLLQRSQPQSEMVGNSEAMQEVFRLIERAGPSDKAILIQGESGTGKELVARRCITAACGRTSRWSSSTAPPCRKRCWKANCSATRRVPLRARSVPKRACSKRRTAAPCSSTKSARCRARSKRKLLRVLEDGSLRRVGSLKERRVNVRLLAATNRDLGRDVEEGRFRQDLFYRINVMSLELPPLRERLGDIRLLVAHFLGPDWDIEDEALHRIEAYHWPGNVRQLINAIERAKIMGDDNLVRLRDLPREVAHGWS